MDDLTVERVLRVVEAIPAGRVAAYGEVGAIVGVGPRLVGRILREWGSSVPWWRVTNAYGDHPLLARALPHWQAEGITVKPNGRGCRMRDFGADLEQLRADSAAALTELDDESRAPSADPETGRGAGHGAGTPARPGHSTGTSSRK
jgi:alkylated DNA nucleotide flippase Atl1